MELGTVMNAYIIATACDALIKEDENAKVTRKALEQVIGETIKNTLSATPEDFSTAQKMVDWLLAVAIKYTEGAGRWNRADRSEVVPDFVGWAHQIWAHALKDKTPATFAHLDRLFKLTLSQRAFEESHVFLCATLKDAMSQNEFLDAQDFDTENTYFKLNVWERVGELGMKNRPQQNQYQQLYTQYLRHYGKPHSKAPLKTMYFFAPSLDYLCHERKTPVQMMVGVIAQKGYKTPLLTTDLTSRFIEQARIKNEDVAQILKDHHHSSTVMDLFKHTPFEMSFNQNVWSVGQIHELHESPSHGYTIKRVGEMWAQSPQHLRAHAVTLGLLNKVTPLDIKNKLKNLLKDGTVSLDDVVLDCVTDAQTLKNDFSRIAPDGAQIVLKKLESGSLWYSMSQKVQRTVFDELTTHVKTVLEMPLNDKGVRTLSTSASRTLGSHIHILYRSLNAQDGLVSFNDANTAKNILLEYPHINTKTQVLNMIKMVEQGLVSIDLDEINNLQKKIENDCTAELLLLTSVSVRPQAEHSIKRRM